MVDDFRAPSERPITQEEAQRLAAPVVVEDAPLSPLGAELLVLKNVVDAPRTAAERIGSMEPLGGLARPRVSQARLDAVRKYKNLQINDVVSKWKSSLYDPSESFVDSLSKMGLSFDLQRSNLFSEEYAKFKTQFPRGAIAPIQTDYGTVYVARTNPVNRFAASMVGATTLVGLRLVL